jgi:hypothetical protein
VQRAAAQRALDIIGREVFLGVFAALKEGVAWPADTPTARSPITSGGLLQKFFQSLKLAHPPSTRHERNSVGPRARNVTGRAARCGRDRHIA